MSNGQPYEGQSISSQPRHEGEGLWLIFEYKLKQQLVLGCLDENQSFANLDAIFIQNLENQIQHREITTHKNANFTQTKNPLTTLYIKLNAIEDIHDVKKYVDYNFSSYHKNFLTWKVMVGQKVRLGAKVALPTTRLSLSAKRLKLRK